MNGIIVLVALFIVFGVALGVIAFLAYRRVLRRAKGIERGLKMVPLLIHLPPPSDDTDTAGNRDVREVMREKVSQAQSLYDLIAGTAQSGFKSSFYGQRHIAFEIISSNGLVHYFAAVPINLVPVVEQAVVTAYPGARLEEVEDHNIFNPQGRLTGTAGGELVLKHEAAYPIATISSLEKDPMEALINSLYKIQLGDGAAVQIMLRPAKSSWVKRSISLVAKKRHTRKGGLGFSAVDVAKATVKAPSQRVEEEAKFQPSKLEESMLEAVEEKTKHPGYEVLVRVLASSSSYDRAQVILRSITTAFALFDAPGSNGFQFIEGRDMQGLVTAFIFRFFPPEVNSSILNSVELATLFHLPDSQFTPTTQVDRQQSKQVDGPANLPPAGLLMGYNFYRGVKKEIHLSPEDRRRHTYIIGQTGTGKSTILENLAVQDMLAGNGFAFIDPHGDTAEKLLSMVPKERAEDVIYFNPADTEHPLGLNLFEFSDPTQKDFLIQESINMLYKLYDPGHTGIIGPRFETWFRNAALTLMADPHGASFIEIPKVFTDSAYLKEKFQYLNDPTVVDFWLKEMGQTSDYHKSEMLGFFTSKFGAFQQNEMMRNIIGQTKSAFDLREVMDGRKILIVNLGKGAVGELNSQLLGMIFVMKFQAAAMSRANVPENQRPDFCLYVDEFQNFSTDSFASILSEARKYRLNLIVANQFIGQLSDEIREAVFGNVGTMVSYRCGPEDAEFLVKQFQPVFDVRDLVNLPNYNAVMRLLVGGLPSQPFSITMLPQLGEVHPEMGLAVKQLSAAKYGLPRNVVETDIFARLQNLPRTMPTAPITAPAQAAPAQAAPTPAPVAAPQPAASPLATGVAAPPPAPTPAALPVATVPAEALPVPAAPPSPQLPSPVASAQPSSPLPAIASQQPATSSPLAPNPQASVPPASPAPPQPAKPADPMPPDEHAAMLPPATVPAPAMLAAAPSSASVPPATTAATSPLAAAPAAAPSPAAGMSIADIVKVSAPPAPPTPPSAPPSMPLPVLEPTAAPATPPIAPAPDAAVVTPPSSPPAPIAPPASLPTQSPTPSPAPAPISTPASSPPPPPVTAPALAPSQPSVSTSKPAAEPAPTPAVTPAPTIVEPAIAQPQSTPKPPELLIEAHETDGQPANPAAPPSSQSDELRLPAPPATPRIEAVEADGLATPPTKPVIPASDKSLTPPVNQPSSMPMSVSPSAPSASATPPPPPKPPVASGPTSAPTPTSQATPKPAAPKPKVTSAPPPRPAAPSSGSQPPVSPPKSKQPAPQPKAPAAAPSAQPPAQAPMAPPPTPPVAASTKTPVAIPPKSPTAKRMIATHRTQPPPPQPAAVRQPQVANPAPAPESPPPPSPKRQAPAATTSAPTTPPKTTNPTPAPVVPPKTTKPAPVAIPVAPATPGVGPKPTVILPPDAQSMAVVSRNTSVPVPPPEKAKVAGAYASAAVPKSSLSEETHHLHNIQPPEELYKIKKLEVDQAMLSEAEPPPPRPDTVYSPGDPQPTVDRSAGATLTPELIKQAERGSVTPAAKPVTPPAAAPHPLRPLKPHTPAKNSSAAPAAPNTRPKQASSKAPTSTAPAKLPQPPKPAVQQPPAPQPQPQFRPKPQTASQPPQPKPQPQPQLSAPAPQSPPKLVQSPPPKPAPIAAPISAPAVAVGAAASQPSRSPQSPSPAPVTSPPASVQPSPAPLITPPLPAKPNLQPGEVYVDENGTIVQG